MSDESGFILVLSDPKAFKGIRKLRIRSFSYWFLVDTSSEVDQAYNRLVAAALK